MIRRVRIRNWRSYRDTEIDLDRPLVFFVAPNGVGKSSLYEAAQRCLFGFPSGKEAGRGVRDDAAKAELSVDLTAGDHEATVTRTITRGGRTSFAATSNSEPIDEASFFNLLTSSWAADRALVDRLVFGDLDPTGRTKATLPIREHLAELMGVTSLVEAAAVLRNARAAAGKAVAGLREDVSGSQDAIKAADAALEVAQHTLEQMTSTHAELSARLELTQLQANRARAWEAYRSAVKTHNADVAALVAEIGQQVSIDPADPASNLDAARRAAEQDLRSARDTQAAADRLAARSAAAADMLAEPVEHCPTCLRPLSDDERAQALHTHGTTSVKAGGDSNGAEAVLEQGEQRLKIIAEFTRRLDRLTAPRPPDHDDPGTGAIDERAELRSRDRDLSERLGETRAHRDSAQALLERERANVDAANRLNRAAREELLLETTAEIFEQVADRYLTERIDPLAQDVAYRWKLLLGQAGLVLEPTGEIRLRRGNLDLEFGDMSGGERAIAGIIVRLLVAASATRIPTCWFDEPLEHLDPRRRAGVAQTLVSAAATGTIDQIVVTTYEEAMVRQLALAAPNLVTVVYADTEPAGRSELSG